jgi:hypothetical protein
MALTNFKKEEIPEGKSDLLCSVDGCSSRWSVRIDGQLPKCSHHQWQQPKVGNTKTYQQYLADKDSPGVAPTVSTWYNKGEW